VCLSRKHFFHRSLNFPEHFRESSLKSLSFSPAQISVSSLDSQGTFIFSLKFYFLYTSVHIFLKTCIYSYTFVTFNQVAGTKSNARPMTSEELAATDLSPIRDETHKSENIHVRESDLDNASARDSVAREEGEVGSEGEDLENVEADLRDLVTTKRSKSLPTSFVFGESKVTTNLIREYEAVGYFNAGDGRAPLDEQIPTPVVGVLDRQPTKGSTRGR
jgi:hypothetical protein